MTPPLSNRTRWLLGLAGTTIGGAGAVATFQTENELGTLALVISGGFSLLIALLGFVPSLRAGPIEIGDAIAQARLAGEIEGVEEAVEVVRAAAAEPDATPASVAEAAAQAAEASAAVAALQRPINPWVQRVESDRMWLISEFGFNSRGSATRTTKDSQGRIWIVSWDQNGAPYRARFYADSMEDWVRRRDEAAQERYDDPEANRPDDD